MSAGKIMKKHLIKLVILIPGLVFLIWWGWAGNFSFKSGSFYPFGPQEDYYRIVAGQNNLGFAKRQVSAVEGTKNLVLTEDFLLNINLAITKGEIRPNSKAVFAPNGSLLESYLTVSLDPAKKPQVLVESRIIDGQLNYKHDIFGSVKELKLPVPEVGPVLISGVIPWLAHQSDLPLGRPIFFNIFDPARLDFRPASLTIVDVTAQDVEKKIYKLGLYIDPMLTEFWIDADGHLMTLRAGGMEAGLDRLSSPASIEAAMAAMAAPPQPGLLNNIPQVFLDLIVNQGLGSLWPLELPKD
jgi:hypothetical protein